MEVAVNLPDDIAKHLQDEWRDLPRYVVEAIALKGHCAGGLIRRYLPRPASTPEDV